MIDLTEISSASQELEGLSDRAAAIVGASLLENQLEAYLRARMIAGRSADRLFKNPGALEGFGAKVAIAESFGLIPHGLAVALDTVGKIRHAFAHGRRQVSFSDQRIAQQVESLPGLRGILQDRRDWQHLAEGKRAIRKLRINNPRRLWEIAIGDLYIRLTARLKYAKQAVPPKGSL